MAQQKGRHKPISAMNCHRYGIHHLVIGRTEEGSLELTQRDTKPLIDQALGQELSVLAVSPGDN